MKKATGMDKKQNWERERVTRKDVLDFVYVLEGSNVVPWRKWNEVRGNYYEVKFCGLTKIPKSKDVYGLYYDTNAHICFAEGETVENKEHNKALFKSKGIPMGFGYKGMVKESEEDNSPVSNQLRLSSIPKGEDLLAYITYNKDDYTEHCKDFREYQEWLENRNEVRYVEVNNHGQKIDGKNMLHCVRLIDMGIEIGQGKGIIVKRDNADFLLSIRRGDLNLKELVELANERLNIMSSVYETSNLPETPDFEMIDELLVDLRQRVYNRKKVKEFTLNLLNQVKSEFKEITVPKMDRAVDFNYISQMSELVNRLEEVLKNA